MGAKKADNRRVEKRFFVNGRINGVIAKKDSRSPLTYVILDVSKRGLGIIFDEKIEAGETIDVSFHIGGKTVQAVMKVKWVQANGEGFETLFADDNDKVFRCGLEAPNDKVDLESTFRTAEGIALEDIY